MPNCALLLLAATLMPLGSFVLLALIGKRMGQPLAGWVATALIGGSCACSLAAMVAWFNGGQLYGNTWGPGDKPIELSAKWLPIGPGVSQDHPGFLDLDIYVDSLTIAMFNTITVLSLLVHVFSIGYMAGQKRFARFFTYLGLLDFSVLGLVIGGSLIQFFVFWQLLAVASYLLAAFWHEEAAARGAAMRSLLIGAVADVGFLVALGVLVRYLGNVSLADMIRWLGPAASAATVGGIHLPSGLTLSTGTLTTVGLLLFAAAIAKSAQFPVLSWLADSSHSAAPAWALMQSVTTAAAGVYLMARTFPILTPQVQWVMAIVGLVTLTLGALAAAVQDDVYHVLAYSTASQLGTIFLALGIGSWMGGLFQWTTHAFFKTLLFLAAGVVIRASGGRRDLHRLGGMVRKTPLAAIAFAVGLAAAIGTPFFCGYYSQEMVLTHVGAFAASAGHGRHGWLYWAFCALPAAGVGISAFALARCWMLIFWRRPRAQAAVEDVREPAIGWFPLAALAVLCVIGGSRVLDIKRMLAQAVDETENYRYVVQTEGKPTVAFLQRWPVAIEPRYGTSEPQESHIVGMESEAAAENEASGLFRAIIPWAMAGGLGLGVLVYLRGDAIAAELLRFAPLRLLHSFLRRGLFWDALLCGVVAAVAVFASRLVAALERYVLDAAANLLVWIVRQPLRGLSVRRES
ncbi:MAG: proton-conducting transporter membrane subunit [Tepidisphaeraceae bacterium]|jgi:NADH:ubiquinone oxidoreductase subunit 5 (subunit L)/multisubunit Na+/H+ antiporter MnhA subunit